MPKPDSYPLFRVQIWWDRSDTDPHFRMGWRRQHGIPERYVVAAFDTSNRELYQQATRFAVWANLQEDLHFRMEFSRSHLYNDITAAKRDHYQRTSYLRRNNQINTLTESDDYWAKYQAEQQAKKDAEARGKELLIQATDAVYANLALGHYPFYFTPLPGKTYIIDPTQKNVIWLDTDFPKGLCIYLADPKVQENRYDWALAIYLYLKGGNETLHSTANEYRYIRYAEWKKADEIPQPTESATN